jgi:hypothetical protein
MKEPKTRDRIRFEAPWSRGLKVSTGIVVVLIAGVTIGSMVSFTLSSKPPPAWTGILVAVVGPLILALAALLAVRGYELKHDALYIQRLLWWTRIPLRGLREAAADGEAMRSSVRLFGCSGFLCQAGWFYNRKLGRFRACATDPRRAVVLRFRDRTWVVTPDDPAQFVARIKEKAGLVG